MSQLLLPGVKVSVGTNSKLTEEPGRKPGQRDALGNTSFEKLPDIPGNLDSHAHAMGRTHAQEDQAPGLPFG